MVPLNVTIISTQRENESDYMRNIWFCFINLFL